MLKNVVKCLIYVLKNVCLLLSPEKDPMIHMYVIKHIAQKLMDAQWKKRILNSLDAFEVKELLV